MFHKDNGFRINLLLCASNMKNFFVNVSTIALNLTVYRNEYNSTTKIMRQELTCQKLVQSNLISIVPLKIVLEVLWYIGCFCKWEKLSTTTSFTCM